MRYNLTIRILGILLIGLCGFLPTVVAAPGDLDTTFSQDGTAVESFSIGNGGGNIQETKIQPDGKIVSAGIISYGFLEACGVTRLNPDGSLDTSFDGDGKTFVQIGKYFNCYAIALQPDGKIVVAGSAYDDSIYKFALARFNANGSLDVSFDGDGRVMTKILTSNDVAHAVLIQTDGKIVAVGSALVSGSNDDFAVARYNTNGSLDSSFGGGDGIVTTAISNNYDIAYGAALQADGKIIAVGVVDLNINDYGVVRYNSDGSLDVTFDGDGKLTTSVGNHYDYAYAAAVQPDGKLIVAGQSRVGVNANYSLVRYNSDGSLDTSFDADGKVTTAIFSGDAIGDVGIQSDGKIVAAGSSYNGAGTSLSIVRYNPNGSLDASFDSDGKFTADFGNSGSASTVAIQADGKIIAAGTGRNGFEMPGTLILRFNSNGSFDTTFDTDGILFGNIGFTSSTAEGVAIQPDGKIVSVGSVFVGRNRNFTVVRYNTDGSLDTSFDGDGTITTNFMTGFYNYAKSVAIQPDGKIIVGGSAGSTAVLIRYNSDGSLDASFDNDGVAITGGTNSYNIFDIKLQTDGKIVAAGSFYNGNNNDFFAARYNANGSLDTSFDGDGIVTTPIGTSTDTANAVLIQPDGKIVAAGESFAASNQFALVRYNADGSLDVSFDGDGKVTTIISSTNYSNFGINEAAILPDGKILATGGGGSGSSTVNFVLARYNANGSLDSSFDGDGKVITPLGGAANAMAIQPDGKIIAAGYNGFGSDNGDFVLTRYNSDGSLDNSYSGDGVMTFDPSGGFNDSINDIALDSGGRVVAVGHRAGLHTVARILGDSVSAKARFDFDGDGKADVSVFRPSNGAWYLNQSQNGFTAVQFGFSTDKIVPADYDGDGKTDVAVYRGGTWYLQRSSLGFTGIAFGAAEDIPVPADYDGDGKDDVAVFRPSNGTWYLLQSTAGFTGIAFGQTGDKPVPADYDGDGKSDIAVNRAGTWYLNRSQAGFTGIQFGDANDKLVPGDYTGDGKADITVFRPSNGFWYTLRSEDASFYAVQFGQSDDTPTPGDYDGDGKFDQSVFRPTNGTWYLNRSTSGFTGIAFGVNSDTPIPSVFIP